MRNIIIKYLSGQPIDVNEAVSILNDYMDKTNNKRPELISMMLNNMNPFGQGMLEHAIQVSVRYLSTVYNINTLTNKDGQKIMVF
jgi:hypothetical protein